MFNACNFSFAGQPSSMYNLMIYDIENYSQEDVAFGNKASIQETRLPNRITPIHHGVTYNDTPLEFRIVFGAEEPMDRFSLQSVALWLTGYQDYQWLIIDAEDMAPFRFKCLITELTPISYNWLPIAFSATVRCDCPYAYGYPFSKIYTIRSEETIIFTNESTVREYFKPAIIYTPSGDSAGTDFSIVNESDNFRKFSFSGLPTGELNIKVDNENCIITETKYDYNLYPYFNKQFFRLVRGRNKLVVKGNGTLQIDGSFLYNIGG